MMAALLSLLASLASGIFIVGALYGRRSRPGEGLLLGSLGLAFGLGMSSMVYFLWLSVFGRAPHGLFLLDGGVVLLSAGIYVLATRGSKKPAASAGMNRATWLLLPVFAAVVVWQVLSVAARALSSPHGSWDAWAIWNMRARFLFRGGEQWRNGFSEAINWTHPDYPLLLPASIARLWEYVGSDTPFVTMGLALLFAFGAVGLLTSALAVLRGPRLAFLAGLVLLFTTSYFELAIKQYADVPLSFYFLAAIVLACLGEQDESGGRGLRMLAGAAAGLAAWTKNEGVLFLVAFFVVLAILALLRRRGKDGWHALLSYGLGTLPIALVLVVFQLSLAPTNDIIGAQSGDSTLSRLLAFSRYSLIGNAYLTESWRIGGGIGAVLLGYLLVTGLDRSDKWLVRIAPPFLLIATMLAGYFLVYVITPHDLGWHLRTSLDRLLHQLWPSFVFLIFLAVRDPFARQKAETPTLDAELSLR